MGEAGQNLSGLQFTVLTSRRWYRSGREFISFSRGLNLLCGPLWQGGKKPLPACLFISKRFALSAIWPWVFSFQFSVLCVSTQLWTAHSKQFTHSHTYRVQSLSVSLSFSQPLLGDLYFLFTFQLHKTSLSLSLSSLHFSLLPVSFPTLFPSLHLVFSVPGFTDQPGELRGFSIHICLSKGPGGFGFNIVGGSRAREFLQVYSVTPGGPGTLNTGRREGGDNIIIIFEKFYTCKCKSLIFLPRNMLHFASLRVS